MSKAGIVTIVDYSNYGNRLQNHALQEVITSLGLDVETIVVNKAVNQINLTITQRIAKIKKKTPKSIFKSIMYRVNYYRNKPRIKAREKAFKEFTEKYIKEVNYNISDTKDYNKLSNKYDYFIVGSDQVWNPSFSTFSPISFLGFAEKHKRIAYAPSFGISEIPGDYLPIFKKGLSGMYKLSVREEAGARIIKDLTGKDAPVLIDPTLLLSKEKWLSIAKVANVKPRGRYLLTYFLGHMPKEYRQKIIKIAKSNDLKILNLADRKDLSAYKVNPSEFIDLIHSAALVCTNSFHGSIFTMLLETPLLIFERDEKAHATLSMHSRMETFISMFKLESRKVTSIRSNEQIFNKNYSHITPILNQEIKKSLDYIKDALQV